MSLVEANQRLRVVSGAKFHSRTAILFTLCPSSDHDLGIVYCPAIQKNPGSTHPTLFPGLSGNLPNSLD